MLSYQEFEKIANKIFKTLEKLEIEEQINILKSIIMTLRYEKK